MFVQALLGFLDKKRNRWEARPKVTIKTYCKHWLAVDLLSVVPYDAIVILVPSQLKLKVMLSLHSPLVNRRLVLHNSCLDHSHG